MKRLPPSFQKDQRYLSFKVRADEDFKFSKVLNSFWNRIETEMGTLEASKADIWVIKNKFNEEKQEGVIRVNKDLEDQLRSALLFVQEIDGEEAFVEVKSSSGMIDKL